MRLPSDYRERVYAGVLGKIIGVYLGRPVENWSHAAIENRFGFVDRFVNEDLGLPLIVPDEGGAAYLATAETGEHYTAADATSATEA